MPVHPFPAIAKLAERELMTTGHVASGHDVYTSLVWSLGDIEEGADELLVDVAEGC